MNAFQKQKLKQALRTKTYLRQLNDYLVSLGGDCVVVWNDGFHTTKEFVSVLMTFGRISTGRHARVRPMDANNCHTNSERLAIKHPRRYQRETGFALSDDGLWRPHSWVFDATRNQIVETVEPRVRYFGITIRMRLAR
jgi:hypothetical protein